MLELLLEALGVQIVPATVNEYWQSSGRCSRFHLCPESSSRVFVRFENNFFKSTKVLPPRERLLRISSVYTTPPTSRVSPAFAPN
ncbi:hypothetical protein E2C01_038681 [Portunus trituberculatus]|uniref:Uncharacterized protein n=1 Tax=Portunus trituberculatus TaxID=210409 RepID=A0A5B7FJ64_PORTR|nr:hypothetical protein [Portunus trituberculatus]